MRRFRGPCSLLGAAALAAAAAGCGDPLKSSSAYNSPLVSISGKLEPFSATPAPLRVGVLWTDLAQTFDDVPADPETIRATVDADGNYTVAAFAPPPAALRTWAHSAPPDDIWIAFVIGEVVVYEDGDGDGVFRVTGRDAGSRIVAPDLYRGVLWNALAFVDQPVQEIGDFPTLGRLLAGEPGYRLAGFNCDSNPPFAFPGDLVATEQNLLVHAEPSAELPEFRSCLRSHVP